MHSPPIIVCRNRKYTQSVFDKFWTFHIRIGNQFLMDDFKWTLVSAKFCANNIRKVCLFTVCWINRFVAHIVNFVNGFYYLWWSQNLSKWFEIRTFQRQYFIKLAIDPRSEHVPNSNLKKSCSHLG